MIDFMSLKALCNKYIAYSGARIVLVTMELADTYVKASLLDYYAAKEKTDTDREIYAVKYLPYEKHIAVTDYQAIRQATREIQTLQARYDSFADKRSAPALKVRQDLSFLRQYIKEGVYPGGGLKSFEHTQHLCYSNLIMSIRYFQKKLRENHETEAADFIDTHLITGEYFFFSSQDLTESLVKVIQSAMPAE